MHVGIGTDNNFCHTRFLTKFHVSPCGIHKNTLGDYWFKTFLSEIQQLQVSTAINNNKRIYLHSVTIYMSFQFFTYMIEALSLFDLLIC